MMRSRSLRTGAALAAACATFALAQACGSSDGTPSGPMGSSENTVTSAGGTLSLAAGAVVLIFPPGAVSSDLTVTVAGGGGPPDALLVAGSDHSFGPANTQFAEPVTLRLSYDPGRIPAGAREEELGLYKALAGSWEKVDGSTVSTGTHTVTASISSFSSYGALAAHVATVDVTPAEASIDVDETVQITPHPRSAEGQDLPERDVAWASSDEGVATVDGDGLVTGVAGGSATVTATAEAAEGSADITVRSPVASVDVTTPVQGVVAGGTVQLTGTARDASDQELTGTLLTWSSSDESVATVDAGGLVTTLAPGEVTITAAAGGVDGSADLTVTMDWTTFAGTWSGSWTNTTYGSTGAINGTITIDVDNLTATMILDVDGTVFGQSDPPPATITGTLKPTTMVVDYTAPLHGPVQFDMAPGDFQLSSVSVPTTGIDAWDYSGTSTSTSHTADFTVHFTGGGTAQGTVTVTKQ